MARELKACRICGAERTSLDVGPGSRLRCWPCRLASVQEQLQKAEKAAPLGGVHRDVERQARCVELYREGKTLQEIGDVYGVSRERIRQILARVGVTSKDGGSYARSLTKKEAKEQRRQANRDGRALLYYGCNYNELLRLNDGVPVRIGQSKAGRFRNQKNCARNRNIRWMLTFPQWLSIWEESGKWSERGKGRDGYCMARVGDKGAYRVGNVYITTCADNVVDYQAELKRRGVVCDDGYRRLPERAARIAKSAEVSAHT